MELVQHYVDNFLMACHFKNVKDGVKWGFVGVYGPNVNSRRSLLWDEMVCLHSLWDIPWCLGGDFNIIWFPSDREGCPHFSQGMADFSDLILNLDLVDLPLVGGNYTWSNDRTWFRLDRFLISSFLEALFLNTRQKHLSKICSDHYPILLD